MFRSFRQKEARRKPEGSDLHNSFWLRWKGEVCKSDASSLPRRRSKPMLRRSIAILLVNVITLLLPVFPVFKGMIIEPGYYMGQMPLGLVYTEMIFHEYSEDRLLGYTMLSVHIVCASALALLLSHLETRIRGSRIRARSKSRDA